MMETWYAFHLYVLLVYANLAFHQLMQGPLDGIQLGTGSYEAIFASSHS